MSSKIVFVCLHGSAKSLIAAQYFTRLAQGRGLDFVAESAGLEPDSAVPQAVVAGLARDGFDVAQYVPRQVDLARLADAARVVSFGCELATSAPAQERWDDLPLVSDGFDRARDAIVDRVERLLNSLG